MSIARSSVLAVLAGCLPGGALLRAQEGSTVLYEARWGSSIVMDCLACRRVNTVQPLAGTVALTEVPRPEPGRVFALEVNLSSEAPLVYRVQGGGTLRFDLAGGLIELALEVKINGEGPFLLTSGPVGAATPWPAFEVRVEDKAPRDPNEIFKIRLAAAPRVQSFDFELLEGSQWVESPIDGESPDVIVPLQGRFSLGEISSPRDAIAVYRLDGLELENRSGERWSARGAGTFLWGRNILGPPFQEMDLELEVNGGGAVELSSGPAAQLVAFPGIDVRLEHQEPGGVLLSILRLIAKPRTAGPIPVLLRGDPNADHRTDLSDAVFVLEYLFLGGAEPDCEPSADVDDGGAVDQSDAIRLLTYLFLAGPPPAPPFPGCGPDSTADGLYCLISQDC